MALGWEQEAAMKQERQEQPADAVVKITLRLPRDLWTRLKHRAIDDDLTIQEMTIRSLEAYLAATPKKRGRP